MATTPSGAISHDQAATLLRMSPGELTRLVQAGVVPRVAPGAYHPGAIIAAYIEHLRAEPERRDKAPTQAEIAAHLDISDRRLRELLVEWSLDHKAEPLASLRLRYIRKLREEAAGRASSGDLDLVQERAALAREQRIAVAMKNATARGEFAPIDALADVLATASAAVSDRLDGLPSAIVRVCPDLPASVRTVIDTAIYKARGEWARLTAELIVPDQDDDDPDTISAATADDEGLSD